MRTRLGWIAAALVVGALAVVTATRLGPAEVVPSTPPSPEPVGTPAAPETGAELRAQLMQAQLENFRLRRRLAQTEGALEKERQAVAALTQAQPAPEFRVSDGGQDESQPLPFPDSLPEPFSPAGFERIALEAAETCGMGLEVVAVDCTEFPCIAWTEAADPEVKRFSMSECSVWRDAFPFGEAVIGMAKPADGGTGTRFFAWMAMPPDPADIRIASRRARERARGMAQALGLDF